MGLPLQEVALPNTIKTEGFDVTDLEYVRAMVSNNESQKMMLLVMGKYPGNRWWVSEDQMRMCYYQLFEDTLLIEFEIFHMGLERLLGREIQSVEFFPGNIDNLRAEAREKYTPLEP